MCERERVISVSLCVLNDISTSDLPLTSYPLFGIIMRSLSIVKMPIVCQAFPPKNVSHFSIFTSFNFRDALTILRQREEKHMSF